jgi:hypothetical protein
MGWDGRGMGVGKVTKGWDGMGEGWDILFLFGPILSSSLHEKKNSNNNNNKGRQSKVR